MKYDFLAFFHYYLIRLNLYYFSSFSQISDMIVNSFRGYELVEIAPRSASKAPFLGFFTRLESYYRFA